MPAWAVGVKELVLTDTAPREDQPRLEGPVHAAGLPAAATAAAASSLPARHTWASTGSSGSRRSTGGGERGPRLSGGSSPIRRAGWSDPRLAFLVASALVGLIVVVFVVTVGLASRPSTVPTLAQNSAFIRSTNIACGESMGAIRLQPGPAGTAAKRSDVAAANANLSRLVGRIQALPGGDSARGQIQGWLDALTRYAADRLRQADAASSPASGRATSLASTVGLDEAQADAFATATDLGQCTLASAVALTPS